MGINESKQITVLNNNKKKSIGTLYIQNCNIMPLFSFMDYKIHRDINIVPIVAIDYSLTNLTFDNENKCIHTLKPGVRNDYISVISAVERAYKNISKFAMGYGMGAKIVKKYGQTSDCFSMTGNIFSP